MRYRSRAAAILLILPLGRHALGLQLKRGSSQGGDDAPAADMFNNPLRKMSLCKGLLDQNVLCSIDDAFTCTREL